MVSRYKMQCLCYTAWLRKKAARLSGYRRFLRSELLSDYADKAMYVKYLLKISEYLRF